MTADESLEELARICREEVPKLEVSREKAILARDALRLSALRAILAELRHVESDSECDFGHLSPMMGRIEEIARLGLGSDPELPERSAR